MAFLLWPKAILGAERSEVMRRCQISITLFYTAYEINYNYWKFQGFQI